MRIGPLKQWGWWGVAGASWLACELPASKYMDIISPTFC